MPTPTFRVLSVAPVLLCASMLALTFAPAAGAKPKTVPAGLRVIDSAGRSLADGTQFSAPARIRTSKGADCFGAGTGGSGARVDVSGGTALGQLAQGATAFPAVDPLSITDAFDFGLGLCGIGRAVSPTTGYWYLKVNHTASSAGGDQTTVKRGDDVLWYLITDYTAPTPDELVLKAPSSAAAGDPVRVKVISYADDGTRGPAAGATVSGAAQPTDAEGRTTVAVDGGVVELRASREGSIPSNSVALCATRPARCKPGYAETIGGTPKADRIVGGATAERILAGPGKDRVDARKGRGRDSINCGPGRDKLILARGSRSKYRSCEKVKIKR